MINGIIINHSSAAIDQLRPFISGFESFDRQCIRVRRADGENYQVGHDDLESYQSSPGYEGFTIMDARTQLDEILRYLKGEDVKMEKKKPTKKKPHTIIDCRGGANLLAIVQGLAAIGGYRTNGGGNVNPLTEGLLFWWDTELDYHYYSTGAPGSECY